MISSTSSDFDIAQGWVYLDEGVYTGLWRRGDTIYFLAWDGRQCAGGIYRLREELLPLTTIVIHDKWFDRTMRELDEDPRAWTMIREIHQDWPPPREEIFADPLAYFVIRSL